jgi:hypothetical protein
MSRERSVIRRDTLQSWSRAAIDIESSSVATSTSTRVVPPKGGGFAGTFS